MDIKENWREITVAEIAELLKNRDTGEHKKFWDALRGDSSVLFTGNIDCPQKPGIPRTMLYLFATAAALQEKAERGDPSVSAIKTKYCLDHIVNKHSDPEDRDMWYYRNLSYLTNGAIRLKTIEEYQSLVEKNFDSSLGDLKKEKNPGKMRLDDLLAALEKGLQGRCEKELRQELDEDWPEWVKGKKKEANSSVQNNLTSDEAIENLLAEYSSELSKEAEIANDLQRTTSEKSNTDASEPQPAAPEESNTDALEPQSADSEESNTDAPEPQPAAPDKNSVELWKQIEGTFAESAVERLNDGVLQMIFTGAPGTGKTYFAKLIARYLGDLQTWLRSPRAYTLVQFHPSYDYTDFVEGLRPVQLGGRDGRMVFVKLDGAFKSFCRSVVRSGNPEALYFFLIDEINRAELSKVFGELMYCLEADKRGAENRVQTQYQHLPSYELDAGTGEPRRIPDGDDVFSDGFYIPENVRILGTMNDIDRSVESMDFALRRRFEWKAAEVDGASLKNALEKMGFPEPDLLAGRTMALNRVLVDQGGRYGLNEHYFIAQGQFANLPSKPGWGPEERLRYVWEYRVEPLLREYLRGEGDPDVTPLIESCKNAFLSSN